MLLTIDTAGRVLDLFTPETPERGVTEVAVALELSKSKAHAMLASLAAVELLRRTDRGRYRLGWRLLSLHRVLCSTTDFSHQARPVLDALSAHTGETVHLGALGENQVVYVNRVEGKRGIHFDGSAVGSAMPAHCSAVGKVLLAHLPEKRLDEVIDARGLARMTARTITDRATLASHLAEVRARGFATDDGETAPEVSCVAAPIVGGDAGVVAALSIAVPTGRFERHGDRYRRMVLKGASYVTKRLSTLPGYGDSPVARAGPAAILASSGVPRPPC